MGDRFVTPGVLSPTPLRKVNSRGSRNITGYVCSRKTPNLTVERESTNELAFVKRAEIDPRVTAILAQPILVHYTTADGTVAEAYPDFAITIDGRIEIHEVKPDGEYRRPDVRDRLRRVADACERYGFPYSVALSGELHRKRDHAAIEDAWRRVQRAVHPMLLRATDDVLADGPATIGDLLAATAGHHSMLADYHAMLAHGHVRADMTMPADATMRLHHRESRTWFDRLVAFNDPRNAL